MADWSPDQWDEQKYAKAKSLLAGGGLTPVNIQTLNEKVAAYESNRGVGAPDKPAPMLQTRAPKPQPEEFAPKPGADGYWAPKRPLGARDYVAEDTGGKLFVWRDMPMSLWKERVAEPARQSAIEAGMKADMELRRAFSNGYTFSPQEASQRAMLIVQGKAAEAMDIDKSPEARKSYEQFNEQKWQEAVQKRSADPNAGPIQRLEKMPDNLPGKVAYGIEKAKEYPIAAAQGAVTMATLGLGKALPGMAAELVGGREAGDAWRDTAEAHPWTQAAGSVVSAIKAPLTLGPAAMRGLYQGLVPKLGKLGALATAGGATAAAEGAGADASDLAESYIMRDESEPGVQQQRDRLMDPERLAIDTAIRGGVGAGGALLGKGIAVAGEGIRGAIARRAMPSPASRSGYAALEADGYKIDPVRGVVVPTEVQAAKSAAEKAGGGSWAENFAGRARGPIIDAIQEADTAATKRMGAENQAYYDAHPAPRQLDRIGVENFNYARDGMREESLAYARSDPNPGNVRVEIYPGERPVLADGRHRLAAAQESGAKTIKADVVTYDADGNVTGHRTQEISIQAATENLSRLKNLRRAGTEALGESRGLPGNPLSAVDDFLRELPEDADAAYTDSLVKQLHGEAAAKRSTNPLLSDAYRKMEEALMRDRADFPELPELKAAHETTVHGIGSDRDLTGARLAKPSRQYLPKKDAGEITDNLKRQGLMGFPVETEAAIDKYMPPELRGEMLLLRGANMAYSLGAPPTTDPSMSRTGALNAVRSFLKPRVYGLGRSMAADTSGLGTVGNHQNIALDPKYPISPALYSWISARVPRASMFIPGMDVAKMIQEEAAINQKPVKQVADLTPQQQQFLQERLQ